MDIVQGVLITVIAAIVLSTLSFLGVWIWNKILLGKKIKRYDNLCTAEAYHLATLKILISDIQEECIEQTLYTLKTLRKPEAMATDEVLDDLRGYLEQRLSMVVHSINNKAAVRQKAHNDNIARLTQEEET